MRISAGGIERPRIHRSFTALPYIHAPPFRRSEAWTT
jgi:hypothetical protein